MCSICLCLSWSLRPGNLIHRYIDKTRVRQSSNISTTLIDMYAKCGRIDCARTVFNGTSRCDVLSFTSMGLARMLCMFFY